jgi:LysR family transcriptional regulator, transcriptional activator of the cysJI operon
MLSLNPHQLHVFLMAAETLNFTQAAQQLQITQPSVSQHVQALEEHFGQGLFARTGRTIELTDAGVALVPLAREIVYLSIRMEEMMASLKGEVQGHLIVGCSTSTGRYLLPKILATFHRQYPQVRATCQVSTREQALRRLVEGKVHVALASDPPFIADVAFEKITTERIILIAPLSHPWAQRGVIDINQLCETDFILPEERNELYTLVHDELDDAGVSILQLRNLISLGSLEAIALSVQEGLGVGFVPELMVNRLVKGRVTSVEVRGLEIRQDVFIGRNLSRPATAAQDAFWEMVLNSREEIALAMMAT